MNTTDPEDDLPPPFVRDNDLITEVVNILLDPGPNKYVRMQSWTYTWTTCRILQVLAFPDENGRRQQFRTTSLPYAIKALTERLPYDHPLWGWIQLTNQPKHYRLQAKADRS